MLGIDQAKILTKIAISLHEVKSERLSPIFMKSSFLWRYLHKLIYLVYTNSWLLVFNLEVMILNSCTHPANIAAIHFHSLWQAPTPQRQKNPYYCFTGQKFHLWLVIGQMLISHLWRKPSDLSEFVQLITNQFFFSKFSLE